MPKFATDEDRYAWIAARDRERIDHFRGRVPDRYLQLLETHAEQRRIRMQVRDQQRQARELRDRHGV